MQMKTRIEIDTKTFVRFWLVLIGFALALLAIYSARTALVLLAVSFFLALSLNAPVHLLAGKLPGRSRILATAVAYIAIVVSLSGIIFLTIPPIVQQTGKFIDSLPALSEEASQQWNGVGDFIDRYHLQPQIDKAVASMQDSASEWATDIGKNIISGAESVVSFAVSMFFVLVLTFLMLVEGPSWLSRAWGLYDNTDLMKRHRKLAGQMYQVVTGYVIGQLTVASIGGIFAGVAVFILSLFFDVPGNLALPTFAVTTILSLIPMFGATLAGALIGLLLLFNSAPAAIIYVLYFFIYQQIENNFISPVIQSKRLELSALTVLVAVTIGFYVLGIFGSLISIPIAGSIKVLLNDYLEENRRKRNQADKPLARLVAKKSKA